MLGREAERNRRDDGDCRGRKCADGRDDRGDREHDPRDQGHLAADHPNSAPDHQVDGAVVLRYGKQVGDADNRQKQTAGEVGQDVIGGHPQHNRTEQEGADEGQCAHVEREHCG
ncbi:hypothetical protein D9M72_514100 [compost metagenome]